MRGKRKNSKIMRLLLSEWKYSRRKVIARICNAGKLDYDQFYGLSYKIPKVPRQNGVSTLFFPNIYILRRRRVSSSRLWIISSQILSAKNRGSTTRKSIYMTSTSVPWWEGCRSNLRKEADLRVIVNTRPSQLSNVK